MLIAKQGKTNKDIKKQGKVRKILDTKFQIDYLQSGIQSIQNRSTKEKLSNEKSRKKQKQYAKAHLLGDAILFAADQLEQNIQT